MYTVVDIETTGLSKQQHQITEIAAVKMREGKIIDSFQTLINPQVKIPSFITKLTGIDNHMVKDAPTISQVLPKFHSFLSNDIFVAHNATFDYGFLEHNARMHGHRLNQERLCTRKLANRLFPQLTRKRLSDLCHHLNIHNTSAHRAMGDAHATALVFNQMLGILQQRGVYEIADVLKFEKMPGRRI